MTAPSQQQALSKEQIDAIIALFTSGKYQSALDKLKTLNINFPEDSTLHNIAGACFAGLGDLASAVKSYKKAIAIESDNAKAHYNLGAALHELGKLDESVKSYQTSLSIDPGYAQAHNNLGNVFKDNKQFDDAIDSYNNAILNNPDYLEAHYSLALVFEELGELKTATGYLEKVLLKIND